MATKMARSLKHLESQHLPSQLLVIELPSICWHILCRYVEKRMLEDHIGKLNDELSQRDKLDMEIEACVCGLYERLKVLEGANERLAARLIVAGCSAKEVAALVGVTSVVSGVA